MSQIINELATVELSNEVLKELDIASIAQNFSNNYRKLDNIQKFRTEYEKKNWLVRWWHNDKLCDAQLDSAEVQAEFSKTIGQLMLISLMQSKRLAEQQSRLNEQQGELKTQADSIEQHTDELRKQNQLQKEQSGKLEKLVHEYFALKGLTEEGAQRLIDIANEVKSTKQGMLEEFAERVNDVQVLCGELSVQMGTLSAGVNEQLRERAEQTEAEIAKLQRETHEMLAVSESTLRKENQAAQQVVSQAVERLGLVLSDLEANQVIKNSALEGSLFSISVKLDEQGAVHREKVSVIEDILNSQAIQNKDVTRDIFEAKAELAICSQQMKANQEALKNFRHDVSIRVKRLSFVCVSLSALMLGMVGGMGYLLKWF